jgi:hypothetical protein
VRSRELGGDRLLAGEGVVGRQACGGAQSRAARMEDMWGKTSSDLGTVYKHITRESPGDVKINYI